MHICWILTVCYHLPFASLRQACFCLEISIVCTFLFFVCFCHSAVELAMIMDRLYGGVCYAGIDTDPELKYPKGAGRVAFSNQQSYIAAISARFVQLQHGEIDKRVSGKKREFSALPFPAPFFFSCVPSPLTHHLFCLFFFFVANSTAFTLVVKVLQKRYSSVLFVTKILHPYLVFRQRSERTP